MPRSSTGFGANTSARPVSEPEPGFVAYAADATTNASAAIAIRARFTFVSPVGCEAVGRIVGRAPRQYPRKGPRRGSALQRRACGRRGDVLARGLRLTCARPDRLQFGRDRDAVEDAERREERPDLQRDDAGERPVRLPEGRREPERQRQTDGGERPERDGDAATERQPRLPGLTPVHRATEQGGEADGDQQQTHGPPQDLPDDACLVPPARAYVPTEPEHEEGESETDPDGQGHHERDRVLAHRRPVSLDPVDPIEAALDLGHGGDRRD